MKINFFRIKGSLDNDWNVEKFGTSYQVTPEDMLSAHLKISIFGNSPQYPLFNLRDNDSSYMFKSDQGVSLFIEGFYRSDGSYAIKVPSFAPLNSTQEIIWKLNGEELAGARNDGDLVFGEAWANEFSSLDQISVVVNGVEYFGPQTNGLDGSDYRFWDENFHFDLIFDGIADQYDYFYDSSNWNDEHNFRISELSSWFTATSMDTSHNQSIVVENIYSKNVSEFFDVQENLPFIENQDAAHNVHHEVEIVDLI